jgi:hypothetical protein
MCFNNKDIVKIPEFAALKNMNSQQEYEVTGRFSIGNGRTG